MAGGDVEKGTPGGSPAVLQKAAPQHGGVREILPGAALFGLGWGPCGACPGPIWVMIAGAPSLPAAACLAGMFAGLAAWRAWKDCPKAPASLGAKVGVAPVEDAGCQSADAETGLPPWTPEEQWS